MKAKVRIIPQLNINILDAMSRAYNTPIDKIGMMICEKGRKRDVVDFKKCYAYIRKSVDGVAYKKIGKEMGGYDHSSIIYYANEVQNQIDLKSSEGMIWYNACKFYLREKDGNFYNDTIVEIKRSISDIKSILRHDDLNAQRNVLRAKLKTLNILITSKSIHEQENTTKDCA